MPTCPQYALGDNITAFQSAGNPNQMFASMGWVGFVNLDWQGNNNPQFLRVTSSTLNLKQDITPEDVLDGRIDKTVYRLGPKLVEGDLGLPLVADIDSASVNPLAGCPTISDINNATTSTLMNNLWLWATQRSSMGRIFYDKARIFIRYANHACALYDRAMVNRMSVSVTEQQPINVTMGVIGLSRSMATDPVNDPQYFIKDFLSPARVLTWNDVTVNGFRGCSSGQPLFYSNQVRDFNFEINNNIERYYTLNGDLFPTDLNARKREVTGSLKLLGRNYELATLAESNQERFTEKNSIDFQIYIGNSTYDPGTSTFQARTGVPIFDKTFTSVVFQIEEMSLNPNDVFETTVNWRAYANDQFSYEAFDPATSPCFPIWSA